LSAEPATILVADDDEDIRQLVRVVLRRDGYRVVTAPDGGEAVRMAVAEAPRLVVLDLKMPVLTGLEVMVDLHGRPDLSDVPVVILTASVSDATAAKSVDAGAAGFLRKPFRADELSSLVRTLLEG
jgi:CheY-like chemotaxis protein